ncbi:MAG: hypothetical protein ACOYOU_21455 [Kiritimatiellia bacterium]
MKTIGIAGGILVMLFVLLLVSGYPEGYCCFWPKIDTRYASGYSETEFDTLTVGMTWDEANKIMCPALGFWTNRNGMIQVFYTSDGNAPFGDFAWFGRGLEISNGVITRVVKTMYYD